MSKKDEALRVEQVLKLELQRIRSIVGQVTGLDDEDEDNLRDAYKSIDRVIDSLAEQPAQQEPVAYIRKDQLQKAAQSPMLCEVTPEPRQDRIGIHTSPPASKPWVGLTDEERNAILDREFKQWWSRHDAVCRAIEAKLREKNA